MKRDIKRKPCDFSREGREVGGGGGGGEGGGGAGRGAESDTSGLSGNSHRNWFRDPL